MKRNIITFVAAISAAILTSCSVARTPVEKLDAFVDKTEEKSSEYSSDQWKESLKEYEALIDEVSSSEENLSKDEQETAVKAIGRYQGLLLKNGIAESAETIKELGALLPQFLNGLSDVLNENSEEITSSLKSLLDTTALNESLNNLGKALEGIFGGLDEN